MRPARPPVATPNRLRLHGRELALPALQGAAIELTEAQIDRALGAFDAALEVLQAWSPSSILRVVYVPSVVTAYRWRQPVVLNVYHSEQVLRTSSSGNLRRSEAIRAKVRAQLLRRGVDFIDTTDAIRRRGQQALLHGPRDWEHVKRSLLALKNRR